MNPVIVALLMLGGAIAGAVVGAVGWLVWTLLRDIERLSAAVENSLQAQSEFSEAVATVSADLIAFRTAIEATVGRLDGLREAVASAAKGAEASAAAIREAGVSGNTMREIGASLNDLNGAVKSFIALAVNTQTPGATPSDLMSGTPLDTTGHAYAYDEFAMAEQEKIRRKARGELESDDGERQVG